MFANCLLSVFSTNTKDVRGSVGTVFVWIIVLFHVREKIFVSRQQFSHNCQRSWFVIFHWFPGSWWKNKFSEHVFEHNVRDWCSRAYTLLYIPEVIKNFLLNFSIKFLQNFLEFSQNIIKILKCVYELILKISRIFFKIYELFPTSYSENYQKNHQKSLNL